jgi:hypothetical protein
VLLREPQSARRAARGGARSARQASGGASRRRRHARAAEGGRSGAALCVCIRFGKQASKAVGPDVIMINKTFAMHMYILLSITIRSPFIQEGEALLRDVPRHVA